MLTKDDVIAELRRCIYIKSWSNFTILLELSVGTRLGFSEKEQYQILFYAYQHVDSFREFERNILDSINEYVKSTDLNLKEEEFINYDEPWVKLFGLFRLDFSNISDSHSQKFYLKLLQSSVIVKSWLTYSSNISLIFNMGSCFPKFSSDSQYISEVKSIYQGIQNCGLNTVHDLDLRYYSYNDVYPSFEGFHNLGCLDLKIHLGDLTFIQILLDNIREFEELKSLTFSLVLEDSSQHAIDFLTRVTSFCLLFYGFKKCIFYTGSAGRDFYSFLTKIFYSSKESFVFFKNIDVCVFELSFDNLSPHKKDNITEFDIFGKILQECPNLKFEIRIFSLYIRNSLLSYFYLEYPNCIEQLIFIY